MKKGRHYSKEEITVITQSAIGKSFREIRDAELITLEDKKIQKGSLGGIIEEYLFGIEANGESEQDFIDAGIELKVTPIKKNKNGYFTYSNWWRIYNECITSSRTNKYY